MLAPRLTSQQVLETAQRLAPLSVTVSDPRLAGIDQTFVRAGAWLTHFAPQPQVQIHFVEWPDLSLAIVYLWPHEPRRSEGLLEAYAGARDVLERLALDAFFLFNPEQGH
jgi:hypothetical protein